MLWSCETLTWLNTPLGSCLCETSPPVILKWQQGRGNLLAGTLCVNRIKELEFPVFFNMYCFVSAGS